MKALTLHQPYASLIADGRKTLETRTWDPPVEVRIHRERIAIHAAKKPVDGVAAQWFPRWEALPRGAIVCTARVLDIARVEDVLANDQRRVWWYNARTFGEITADDYGNFGVGRYLWKLGDVRPVHPPVYARGYQRLWTVLESAAREMEARA